MPGTVEKSKEVEALSSLRDRDLATAKVGLGHRLLAERRRSSIIRAAGAIRLKCDSSGRRRDTVQSLVDNVRMGASEWLEESKQWEKTMTQPRIQSLRLASTTVFLLLAAGSTATAQLRFEAEDYTEPKTAWQTDKFSETKWNLWSTDRDAKAKWSEGIVLQSPRVMEERATPEEGAPPLHTHLTGIPKGIYTIEMKSVGRVLGISLDGKTWRPYRGGPIVSALAIEDGTFDLWVDDRYAMEDPKSRGSGYYDALLLFPEKSITPKPKVKGWAEQRAPEPMGRGVIALRTSKDVYVSWRLLQSDPAGVAFDVYRTVEGEAPFKLNTNAITETTDFLDASPPKKDSLTYEVRPPDNVSPSGSTTATPTPAHGESPYLSLKLSGDSILFQKVGVADLNGDGQYDFVIKQPHGNVDPYVQYWYPSMETYKLEAYLADGTFLWRKDLGWAIERGI